MEYMYVNGNDLHMAEFVWDGDELVVVSDVSVELW
jgi:hypothetical protein